MTTTKEIFNALVGDNTINSMRNYDGHMGYVPNNQATHKPGILDVILIAPLLNRLLFFMIRRVCSSLYNAFLNDNNGIGEAFVVLSLLTIFLLPLALFIIGFIIHWLPYVIEVINNIVKYTVAILLTGILVIPVMAMKNLLAKVFTRPQEEQYYYQPPPSYNSAMGHNMYGDPLPMLQPFNFDPMLPPYEAPPYEEPPSYADA